MNYKAITSLEYICNCTGITIGKWDSLMEDHKKANKKEIDRLVKKLLPELYEELALNFYNPYDYYRTEKHLILVHSSIEYFLTFK